MVRQLLRLTQAVYDASVAAGQLRQAQLLANDTRVRLLRLRDALPQPAQPTPAGSAQQPSALDPQAQQMLERMNAGHAHEAPQAASALPTKLQPDQRRTTAKPGADRGPER
ncbi:hypothetical protein [Georgenia satyanarayanai]|uniref:hypothetical protein n=1 Tax=Georgenia satyanarayanai TaxID=860221 RepID=UPI00203C1B46|nr:hypothetical protein [Georgenia satyanarayanai]